MFNYDTDDTVIIEAKKALEAALSTNASTERALRKLIRKEILQARKKVVADIKFKHGDPRSARQSVRTSVYKKILGANINIFSSRRTHTPTNYEPPRKLKAGQRGGNRRKRSERTDTVMHYGPLDRGFILRFQNAGTTARSTKFGNRGAVTAKNFFAPSGDRVLAQAADNLAGLIEEELDSILNKTNNK